MENHRENQVQLAAFMDFENIAIWAQENYYDPVDLKRVMGYLESRGSVVIKRAYGDWSNWPRYLNDLVDNSFDLIQMYSIRSGKNRADIRLSLDAFETALHRAHVKTMAIISGDSDFGELASKLREYGIYVIGIGPRAITHPLLVKSCNEFIYLETILGEKLEHVESSASAQETARKLLISALEAHGMRSELPVPGAKLKQTLLSMDPTFNEVNLGYPQFRAWLEDSGDLVSLYFKGLQMFVAPANFTIADGEFSTEAPRPELQEEPGREPVPGLPAEYRSLFGKVITVDMETRHDILRFIHRELSDHPEGLVYSNLLEKIETYFEAKGRGYSRSVIRKVMQLGYHQQAYSYPGTLSMGTTVRLADDVESQTQFIQRAESRFPYAIVQAGLDLDLPEVAMILLSDRNQTDYVQELLDDLERREQIVRRMGRYQLAGDVENPLLDDANLEQIWEDIRAAELPPGIDQGHRVTKARELAHGALAKRSRDFSGASKDLLFACHLQWHAFQDEEADATLEDLRWYIASYASVRAGELAQVFHDLARAKPYYLAFFSLVQEDTPLWDRMRGLINPMLSFYWRNLARELRLNLETKTSPAEVAILFATTDHENLRSKWLEATRTLAQINPSLLQRIANNIRLLTGHPRSSEVADTIEGMLNGTGGAVPPLVA